AGMWPAVKQGAWWRAPPAMVCGLPSTRRVVPSKLSVLQRQVPPCCWKAASRAIAVTRLEHSGMSSAERHWAGLALSLLTALMWGTLPIALQLLMQSLDVNTITWARFVFSAGFVWVVLQRRGQLPSLRGF